MYGWSQMIYYYLISTATVVGVDTKKEQQFNSP